MRFCHLGKLTAKLLDEGQLIRYTEDPQNPTVAPGNGRILWSIADVEYQVYVHRMGNQQCTEAVKSTANWSGQIELS